MESKIINLTRKSLPRLSPYSRVNRESINNMPEMVLSRKMLCGDKSIIHVDMNHCTAARISKKGINTIYTDALNGCNSVGIIAKALDNKPVTVLSHYVPTNVDGQTRAIEKQLNLYDSYLDKSFTPKLFFNIRGWNSFGKLEAVPNPIVEKVKNILKKFFPQGIETTIIPYLTKIRPAFFSSANIFQFVPADLSKVKITFVGEKEKFLDLKI